MKRIKARAKTRAHNLRALPRPDLRSPTHKRVVKVWGKWRVVTRYPRHWTKAIRRFR